MSLALNVVENLELGTSLVNDEPERFNDQDIKIKQMQLKEELLNICLQNEDLMNKINSNIEKSKPRVIFPVNIFDSYINNLSTKLLQDPAVYAPAVDEAMKDIYKDASAPEHLLHKVRCGFTGWMAGHSVTPRGLRPKLLNRLVCVEGIVTRCSTVKPKLVRSVHLAEASGSYFCRDYYDHYSVNGRGDANTLLPATDPEGNVYRMEVGLSSFIDFQRLSVQEMPENAPTGQLPCSIDILVEGDLVDSCKAGDRVAVWGVYKALPRKEQGTLVGYSSTFILANNIEILGGLGLTLDIAPDDIKLVKQIAGKKNTLLHLAYSVSPAICGSIDKKKGLLLQLIGGTKKILENGAVRVRGDIHVLLIGDPSCGKSQMLRFMMNASTLALSTTGRGSSGVGLTAAVVIDKDTGSRRLEAGAMVMADGGLVCIDEFDKMVHEDRVAIHEVMEQQTVSIAKAGIQTTLNARCSVLAAANPAYGCFDYRKDISKQISFPDSLLSRFDLIYLVHDSQSASEDRKISRTVIKHHAMQDQDCTTLVAENDFSGSVDRTAWVVQPRTDATALVSNFARKSTDGNVVYSLNFLKKYIQVARNMDPVLTQDAMESIAEFYINLRKKTTQGGAKSKFATPTARTLEAVIRLSTAHAKLKLKTTIDPSDVREAKSLLTYALLGEQYDSDEEEEELVALPAPTETVTRKRNVAASVDKVASRMGHTTKKSKLVEEIPQPVQAIPDMNLFSELLGYTVLLRERGADALSIDDFVHGFHETGKGHIGDQKDVYIKNLELKGKIMIVEGEIWLI